MRRVDWPVASLTNKRVNDLPVIGSADYKAAASVELHIKDGGDLVGGVVCVAKHSLHPLEVGVGAKLDLSA